jgi:hypothetical protein
VPAACEADEQRLDRTLRRRPTAAALADGDHADAGARVAEDPAVDEVVEQDDVAAPEARAARTVRSSGSPGPAPMRTTRPVTRASRSRA